MTCCFDLGPGIGPSGLWPKPEADTLYDCITFVFIIKNECKGT